ncbi:MAG: beta-lactamase family protein [Epulopiscium sp.]|mgnify:CR=1 FL=1|nr:beta-lactamase family protein [Candidatus Epulonipiscium sp.]
MRSTFKNTVKLLEKGLQDQVYPYGVIGIGNPEGEIFRYCVGDVTADKVFDIASLTKIVCTSTIAFQLIQQGDISLHDKLSDFFDVPKDKKDITIQNLMTHTSGLPAYIDLENHCKSPDNILETILNWPLAIAVGTDVIYSCMGYIILAKIIEKVKGMPLDIIFNENIAKPLGLKNTGFCLKHNNIALTSFNDKEEEYFSGIVHDGNARYAGGISGNAGLFSDISDLSKFAQMLSKGGVVNDTKLINERMLKVALKNYTRGMNEDRGLGFSLKNSETHPAGDLFAVGSFGHTGFTGTSLWVDKNSGIYVVFLTNRVYLGVNNTKIIRFRRLLHNSIINEML